MAEKQWNIIEEVEKLTEENASNFLAPSVYGQVKIKGKYIRMNTVSWSLYWLKPGDRLRTGNPAQFRVTGRDPGTRKSRPRHLKQTTALVAHVFF